MLDWVLLSYTERQRASQTHQVYKYTVLFCTLYSTLYFTLFSISYSTVQYSGLYSTVHCTVEYSTLYCTVQYSGLYRALSRPRHHLAITGLTPADPQITLDCTALYRQH